MSKGSYETFEYLIPQALKENKNVVIHFSNTDIVVSEYISETSDILKVKHQRNEYHISKDKIEYVNFIIPNTAVLSTNGW